MLNIVKCIDRTQNRRIHLFVHVLLLVVAKSNHELYQTLIQKNVYMLRTMMNA